MHLHSTCISPLEGQRFEASNSGRVKGHFGATTGAGKSLKNTYVILEPCIIMLIEDRIRVVES